MDIRSFVHLCLECLDSFTNLGKLFSHRFSFNRLDAKQFTTFTKKFNKKTENFKQKWYKNVDFEALLPLATGTARKNLEGLLRLLNGDGEFLQEAMNNVDIDDIVNNMDKDAIPEGMSKAELADEALQMMPEIMQGMVGMMQEMYSGAEIVSSEYVGDEFHFRISVPMPKIEMPQLPATMKIEMPEMPELPESIEQLVKMQKVDGAWRIYDTGGK